MGCGCPKHFKPTLIRKVPASDPQDGVMGTIRAIPAGMERKTHIN
jgi:hypothetical protein